MKPAVLVLEWASLCDLELVHGTCNSLLQQEPSRSELMKKTFTAPKLVAEATLAEVTLRCVLSRCNVT